MVRGAKMRSWVYLQRESKAIILKSPRTRAMRMVSGR